MAAPKNVASLLDTVKQKLKLDTTSGGDTFNKVVAQVMLHDNKRKHSKIFVSTACLMCRNA